MARVDRVFLLWHVHHRAEDESGEVRHFAAPDDYWSDEEAGDDVKHLGVYSTRALAQERIGQARQLPGFRDEPDCFHIEEAALDEPQWTQGYATVASSSWYGVRCVFRHRALGVYEERVTLWTARSLDEAIGRAETEAREYCEVLDEVEYAGFAEAFRMDGAPGEGAEVFSLMRESGLPPGEYVGRFFATGDERTG
jgi:hypothetical protein